MYFMNDVGTAHCHAPILTARLGCSRKRHRCCAGWRRGTDLNESRLSLGPVACRCAQVCSCHGAMSSDESGTGTPESGCGAPQLTTKGDTPMSTACLNNHKILCRNLVVASRVGVNGRVGIEQTQLLDAVARDDHVRLQLLLQHSHVAVPACSIFHACESNSSKCLQLLLAKRDALGLDVNAAASCGATGAASIPLHATTCAVVLGLLCKVPELDVNSEDTGGRTALQCWASRCAVAGVWALLGHPGVRISGTAVVCTARHGDEDMLKAMLDHPRFDQDVLEEVDLSAFAVACTNGRYGAARLLHDRCGVDLTAPEWGLLPVQSACMGGSVELVKWMVRQPGVFLNTTHESPLTCAARGGHVALVEWLLKQPSVDPASPVASEALCSSVCHPEVVRVLLADPRVAQSPACTQDALLQCALDNSGKTAKLLLQRAESLGIDVNRTSESGLTAFLTACKEGSHDVAVALLEHPATDVTATEPGGTTALHLASCLGNTRLLYQLLDCERVDVASAMAQDPSPLAFACNGPFPHNVVALLSHPRSRPPFRLDSSPAHAQLLHSSAMGSADVAVALMDHFWRDAWVQRAGVLGRVLRNDVASPLACAASAGSDEVVAALLQLPVIYTDEVGLVAAVATTLKHRSASGVPRALAYLRALQEYEEPVADPSLRDEECQNVARICKDTRLARVVHAVVRQRAWSRRRTMLLLRELAASRRVVHVSHAGCDRSS